MRKSESSIILKLWFQVEGGEEDYCLRLEIFETHTRRYTHALEDTTVRSTGILPLAQKSLLNGTLSPGCIYICLCAKKKSSEDEEDRRGTREEIFSLRMTLSLFPGGERVAVVVEIIIFGIYIFSIRQFKTRLIMHYEHYFPHANDST